MTLINPATAQTATTWVKRPTAEQLANAPRDTDLMRRVAIDNLDATITSNLSAKVAAAGYGQGATHGRVRIDHLKAVIANLSATVRAKDGDAWARELASVQAGLAYDNSQVAEANNHLATSAVDIAEAVSALSLSLGISPAEAQKIYEDRAAHWADHYVQPAQGSETDTSQLRAIDTSGWADNSAQNLHSEIKIGGKVVARIHASGLTEVAGDYAGHIKGLAGGGTGPEYANELTIKIAAALEQFGVEIGRAPQGGRSSSSAYAELSAGSVAKFA